MAKSASSTFSSWKSSTTSPSKTTCYCGIPCKVQISRTAKNPGRKFFGCGNYNGGDNHCKYFLWCDCLNEEDDNSSMIELLSSQTSSIGNAVEKVEHITKEIKLLVEKVDSLTEEVVNLNHNVEAWVENGKRLKAIFWSICAIIVAKWIFLL